MTTLRFEGWEKQQMHSPKFRAAAYEQEPAYQIARLRILRRLTQSQLARLVGTQQPSIARLESGKTDPDFPFLRQLAEALDARVEIRIVANARKGAALTQSSATACRRLCTPSPSRLRRVVRGGGSVRGLCR